MFWLSNVLWECLDDNIWFMDIFDDFYCFLCIFFSLIDIRWYMYKGGNNLYIFLGVMWLFVCLFNFYKLYEVKFVKNVYV